MAAPGGISNPRPPLPAGVPGDRRTDSVSSYGWFYNLIWFNNGYHQEHHYRPQTHWTRVKALRANMLPDEQRRVVRGAHWFNLKGTLAPKSD